MEPAGSVGTRPPSMLGRKVEMILAVAFIFWMFVLGAGSFLMGVGGMLQNQDFVVGGFLVLMGFTFMSGLPFLLRPLSNCLRAKRLTYIVTTSRAMIVRRGHAWAEIWVRSPVILSVSFLFIYGVIMFSILFVGGVYDGFVNDAGWNSWLARGICLLCFVPLCGLFATLGYIGIYGQGAIIMDAINRRHDVFVRSFTFSEIRRNDFPVVSRLRKGGFGDVILSQDGHWDYHGDSSLAPSVEINAVGFLSVPDAKKVMETVDRVVTS